VFPAAAQFMEGLIREFPVIEVSIRTSSRKLRSVLDVFYQVGGVVISQQQQQQQQQRRVGPAPQQVQCLSQQRVGCLACAQPLLMPSDRCWCWAR
jgi:hypothetical protein